MPGMTEIKLLQFREVTQFNINWHSGGIEKIESASNSESAIHTGTDFFLRMQQFSPNSLSMEIIHNMPENVSKSIIYTKINNLDEKLQSNGSLDPIIEIIVDKENKKDVLADSGFIFQIIHYCQMHVTESIEFVNWVKGCVNLYFSSSLMHLDLNAQATEVRALLPNQNERNYGDFSVKVRRAEYSKNYILDKVVLSNRSEYFKKFLNNSLPTKSGIYINRFGEKTMDCIVHFMYSGTLVNMSENIIELVEAAKYFGIVPMERLLEAYACRLVSKMNTRAIKKIIKAGGYKELAYLNAVKPLLKENALMKKVKREHLFDSDTEEDNRVTAANALITENGIYTFTIDDPQKFRISTGNLTSVVHVMSDVDKIPMLVWFVGHDLHVKIDLKLIGGQRENSQGFEIDHIKAFYHEADELLPFSTNKSGDSVYTAVYRNIKHKLSSKIRIKVFVTRSKVIPINKAKQLITLQNFDGLCEVMKAFQNDSNFCNVQLKIGETVIEAHMAMLAKKSEFFKRKFGELTGFDCMVKDVTSECNMGLLAVVKSIYMYTDFSDVWSNYESETCHRSALYFGAIVFALHNVNKDVFDRLTTVEQIIVALNSPAEFTEFIKELDCLMNVLDRNQQLEDFYVKVKVVYQEKLQRAKVLDLLHHYNADSNSVGSSSERSKALKMLGIDQLKILHVQEKLEIKVKNGVAELTQTPLIPQHGTYNTLMQCTLTKVTFNREKMNCKVHCNQPRTLRECRFYYNVNDLPKQRLHLVKNDNDNEFNIVVDETTKEIFSSPEEFTINIYQYCMISVAKGGQVSESSSAASYASVSMMKWRVFVGDVENYTDFRICLTNTTPNEIFQVHKFVLHRRSPYFQRRLEEADGLLEEACFGQFEAKTMGFILSFIYGGVLKTSQIEYYKLMHAAKFFELKHLVFLIEKQLCRLIPIHKIEFSLRFAESYDLPMLEKLATFRAVYEKPGFACLKDDKPGEDRFEQIKETQCCLEDRGYYEWNIPDLKAAVATYETTGRKESFIAEHDDCIEILISSDEGKIIIECDLSLSGQSSEDNTFLLSGYTENELMPTSYCEIRKGKMLVAVKDKDDKLVEHKLINQVSGMNYRGTTGDKTWIAKKPAVVKLYFQRAILQPINFAKRSYALQYLDDLVGDMQHFYDRPYYPNLAIKHGMSLMATQKVIVARNNAFLRNTINNDAMIPEVLNRNGNYGNEILHMLNLCYNNKMNLRAACEDTTYEEWLPTFKNLLLLAIRGQNQHIFEHENLTDAGLNAQNASGFNKILHDVFNEVLKEKTRGATECMKVVNREMALLPFTMPLLRLKQSAPAPAPIKIAPIKRPREAEVDKNEPAAKK